MKQFLSILLILCGVFSLQAQEQYPLGQSLGSMVWKPDDRAIAFTTYAEPGILIFETETFDLVLSVPVDDEIHDMIWSPDGQYIAVALSNGEIHVFNAVNGEHEATLRGDVERFIALAWQTTENRLIGLGQNTESIQTSTFVHVWNTETWELEQVSDVDLTFNTGGSGLYPFMIEFAFDETQIVLSRGRHLLRINLDDLTIARNYFNLGLEAPTIYSINNENQMLLGAVNEFRLYDFETESTIFSNLDVLNVTNLKWNPDGIHYLYTEQGHDIINIRSIADPDFIVTLTDISGSLSWNNDGNLLAVYQEEALYLFDWRNP